MESRRWWQARARSQLLSSQLTSLRVTTLTKAADTSGVLRIGAAALARSLVRIGIPLLALWLTQAVRHLPIDRLTALGLPERAMDLVVWVTSTVPKDFDSAALPTAAIEVAGVFVAVYFATVTFVVSTTYRDASRRLRDNIIRQPESRWYAAFFTQAVVYVALALALPVIDARPTHLTLVVAGVSAALVVLSFGRIWTTLFVLLEPTSLFAQIQRDIVRWVNRAHKLSEARKPSVGSIRRANRRIQNDLQVTNDLVTLILDREYETAGGRGISASHDPRIATTMQSLFLIWESYSRHKHAIRVLPGWNPTRAQAKDWFLASHSEVSVAVATGTALVPSEVVDDLWFERFIADAIERVLDGRELRSVESAVGSLVPFSRILAARGQFEELRLWLTATTLAAMGTVSGYADERGEIDLPAVGAPSTTSRLSREQHFALPGEAAAHNLVDFVLLEVLSATLGYGDYFARMRPFLAKAPERIRDRRDRVLADKSVVEIVANLRQAIDTEREIEGIDVTPDTSLRQLVARALATRSIDEVEDLLDWIEAEIWPWVIHVGASRSWAAGAALGRASELAEKLATMTRGCSELLSACESAHVEKDDRWPDTGTDAIRHRALDLADRLELPVAGLAATIDSAPDTDRPDHFGWAYYRAHENVLRRVLTRRPPNPDEYRKAVARLYYASELATRRLLTTVMSTTLENEAIATVENEATQTDWMGDLYGGLGFDPATGGGRCSAAPGRSGLGRWTVDRGAGVGG